VVGGTIRQAHGKRTHAESAEPDPCILSVAQAPWSEPCGPPPRVAWGVHSASLGATGRAESAPFDRLRIKSHTSALLIKSLSPHHRYTLPIMIEILIIAGITATALLMGTAVLHLLPCLGKAGRSLSAAACRAPLLDLVITYFTVAPQIVGLIIAGWRGLIGGLIGQVATVLIWILLHELTHLDAHRGPRIVKVLNHIVGPWRNHAALWVTALVVPMFWLIRVAEILLYPFLIWFVRFPKYKQGEWINLSRHKFQDLVGHDLIWCLYCDWMTGVWSFGSEILRNVESFWCPIRFMSDRKCKNCEHDFPDVSKEWVKSDASMEEVTDLLKSKYATNINAWFGHPARLTINEIEPSESRPDEESTRESNEV